VESIRGPELLFQPSMMGICEAGLSETIDYVLKLFPAEDQQRLVDNIFITGGIAKLPGLKERLMRELMEIRPFQSSFAVKIAADPSLGCWKGMKKFASSGSNVSSFSISKEEYYEQGGEYIKENALSNRYYKSPLEKNDSMM
jgi:actin-related protein 5